MYPGRHCNIDTFNEATVIEDDCGFCNLSCLYCGAQYWKDEANSKNKYTICCGGGKISLDPIHAPPPLIRSYMERTLRPVSLLKTFFSKIRWLNTSASFASCKFFYSTSIYTL